MIVYTTVFGETKPLHEPAIDTDARFVCFTDQPISSQRWEIIRTPVTATPARDCRRLKQLSHVVFPEATSTLWIDSCFSLRMDPLEVAAMHEEPVVAFRHPHRSRITDEAEVIIDYGKAREDSIRSQLAAYRADGFDTEASPQTRLTAGGFLIRRHTEAVKRFNESWHHEVQARSLRDQMSLDYALWKTRVSVGYLQGTHLDNRYAQFTRYKRAAVDF